MSDEEQVYEGKYFFTIYDFEGASNHYKDPEWDGDAIEVEDDTVTPKAKLAAAVVEEIKKKS